MTDAELLRDRAHEILRDQRFHERKSPAPFRGVLRWLGDRVEPVWRFFEPAFEWLAELWASTFGKLLLIGFVAVVVLILSRIVIRRGSAAALTGGGGRFRGRREDPDSLEREAEAAEERGDFALAIRLRFRAGVIRLQMAGRVQRERTTPTRAIGHQIDSPAFDELGQTFDAVAYGDAAATNEDARASREAWDRVLAESAR